MKRHLLPFFAIALLAALLPLASCDPFGWDDNIVRVTEDITTATTWDGDRIYVIERFGFLRLTAASDDPAGNYRQVPPDGRYG